MRNVTLHVAATVAVAMFNLFGCRADPVVEFVDVKSADTADAGSTDAAPDAGTTGTDVAETADTAEVAAPKPCEGVKCDDNDPCTDDSCDKATGKCVFASASGLVCDDSKACTTGDSCKDGKCVGTAKKCDDNDPCTSDACNPKDGQCANSLIEGCAPSDPCATVNCDDGNECTDDSCDKIMGCQNKADDGNLCDDNDQCTESDKCVKGQCLGKDKFCYDGQPCTDDQCDSIFGCQFVNLPYPFWICDDGYPCTLNDVCLDGKCVSDKKKDCNDGDPCTTDGCDAKNGKCFHDNISGCGLPPPECLSDGACQDGNGCTADSCASGKCLHSAKASGTVCATETSTSTFQCNATAICVAYAKPAPPECSKDADCLDTSTCTSDSCASGKCQHTAIPNCGAAGNQPSYKLSVTWKANAAAKAAWAAAGADKLTLGGFCKGVSNAGVSGPDVVVWNEQHASGAPTADELKFEQDVIALASCQWQIYAWKSGSQVAWGASAGPVVLGSLSYAWNGYSAQNVGVVTNGKGGYNWGFSPGADSDGDGKLDGTDTDKYDGSK